MTIAPPAPSQPVWRTAVASFAPTTARPKLERLLRFAPVVLILVLQIALTYRPYNLANPDEALYINAGHQYFTQWGGGAAAPNYGSYFSGFPYAYPVFAAVLDHLGGLPLVRLASLAMILTATLSVGAIGRHLGGPIRGYATGLTSMVFAVLSGSVLYVGNTATFDAMCCSLVIAAAALVITRQGSLSAVIAGLAGAAAAIAKYTGGAFIPVVVVLALVSSPTLRRGLIRASLVAVTATFALLDFWVLQHVFVGGGVAFTTSSRTAENYRPYGFLLRQFALGAGALTLVAVIGIGLTWRSARSVRLLLLELCLLGAALAIPVSQLHIHEYTSFNKHMVFLTLFAAPLAGQLVIVRARLMRFAVTVIAFYLVGVLAVVQVNAMYFEWPYPSTVLGSLNSQGAPGTYLGVGAQEVAFYEGHPGYSFVEPYGLYGAGDDAIREALAADSFAGVWYASGSSGSAELDRQTNLMVSLLKANPDYRLVGSWPKHKYDTDRWYLWVRVTPPPAPAK